ncbi:hypothetical protein ACC697_38090, partial [Rhizobium ruizarguesonis]
MNGAQDNHLLQICREGAGTDDGGWISTYYLIAEIVVIPLSAWLARVFSLRNYMLTNAILFLIFSVACAFA